MFVFKVSPLLSMPFSVTRNNLKGGNLLEKRTAYSPCTPDRPMRSNEVSADGYLINFVDIATACNVNREQILNYYRCSDYSGAIHGKGGYSDPTMNKVVQLMDDSNTIARINKIREFIETLSLDDKTFLIKIWQTKNFYYRFTAETLNRLNALEEHLQNMFKREEIA
jgi:hypothetical protein